jgi:hypothetical protein
MFQRTEFSHWIFTLTGVSGGLTQVRKFIRKTGFNHLRSGHIPAKADFEKHREWKEKIVEPSVEESEKGNSCLFSCDAAHFVL